MPQQKYIPGVCNIGPAETKRRKQSGWVGLALTVILRGILVYINAAPVWQLLLFFPAMMSATGFLQAYMHFCAYFGFASLFNFGNVGKTDSVQQVEFRVRDRHKAWQIVTYSVLIGILVSVLAVYVK